MTANNSFLCTGQLSSASFRVEESKATGHAVSQDGLNESTAPVQWSLASVVTKILFESSLLCSITARHSCDTTICFILSKAF